MATQGTADINFGTRASEGSIAVTGQTGIVAGSAVEAWIRVVASGSTTADEALWEDLKITAGTIVAGTGFTIYAEVRRGYAHGTYTINYVWN